MSGEIEDADGAGYGLPQTTQARPATTTKKCPRKPNRPPGERALAEAARLRGQHPGGVVVDLDQYARIAKVAGQR